MPTKTRRTCREKRGGITRLLSLMVGFTMTVGLHGCAALPLTVVGGSVLGAGTGAIVKTGTEYTIGGSLERTFTIPKNAVRFAVLQAFDRAGVNLSADKVSGDREEFKGDLQHRKVRMSLFLPQGSRDEQRAPGTDKKSRSWRKIRPSRADSAGRQRRRSPRIRGE